MGGLAGGGTDDVFGIDQVEVSPSVLFLVEDGPGDFLGDDLLGGDHSDADGICFLFAGDAFFF